MWDSGSGTGSIFFFNYDYIDEKMRTLIREPKFRQASRMPIIVRRCRGRSTSTPAS